MHVQDMHVTESASFCPSSSTFYLSLRTFKKHFEDVHSSPYLSSYQNPREHKSINSAFSGTVEPFFLESKISFGNPKSKFDVKPIVNKKVNENVNVKKQLRKNQFYASFLV